MTRADLRKLVDEVPDARVESVSVVLRRVIDDPEVVRLLGIPWDDEPITEEKEVAVREAMKEPPIPWERVRRELLG